MEHEENEQEIKRQDIRRKRNKASHSGENTMKNRQEICQYTKWRLKDILQEETYTLISKKYMETLHVFILMMQSEKLMKEVLEIVKNPCNHQ